MMPLRTNLILLVLFFLLGCAGTASKAAEDRPLAHGVPAWVLNPNKPGFQSVVGSAPRQEWGGRAAQLRVAEMKARQELAQQLRVTIESTNQVQIEERAGTVRRSADVETRLQSHVALRLNAAQIVEEWADPQSGELYIWLATPNF